MAYTHVPLPDHGRMDHGRVLRLSYQRSHHSMVLGHVLQRPGGPHAARATGDHVGRGGADAQPAADPPELGIAPCGM